MRTSPCRHTKQAGKQASKQASTYIRGKSGEGNARLDALAAGELAFVGGCGARRTVHARHRAIDQRCGHNPVTASTTSTEQPASKQTMYDVTVVAGATCSRVHRLASLYSALLQHRYTYPLPPLTTLFVDTQTPKSIHFYCIFFLRFKKTYLQF